jgi:menaquinone-9 beta-reductase
LTSETTAPRACRAPVVVIGAGPAGCAAALSLLQKGILPLLIEKGAPGKDKACGDAWSPEAVEELRSFEISERELRSNFRAFSRIDGYFAERKVWSVDYGRSEGFVARRAIVDQWLRKRVSDAGGQIWHRARATALRAPGGRLELTIEQGEDLHTLAPSAVILASGSGCRIARAAGLDGQPSLGTAISTCLRTDGNLSAPAFLFGDPSPGYVWIFPSGTSSSNVGVCALSRSATPALRPQLKTLLARLGAQGSASPRGAIEAMWSGKGSNWGHEAGVVSCGDAAGLVDPTCGEGLTGALVSGKHAGAAIASYLAGNPRALFEYSRWVRHWGQSRYASSRENHILAGWVGLASAERHLLSLVAGWLEGE